MIVRRHLVHFPEVGTADTCRSKPHNDECGWEKNAQQLWHFGHDRFHSIIRMRVAKKPEI